MRIIVQRVHEASVTIDHTIVGAIGKGLCVFVGMCHTDQQKDVAFLAKKVVRLRVFPDAAGKMSQSVVDIHGDIIIISQFTLYGNCKNGCRPDFTEAAPPSLAEPLYEAFVLEVERELGKPPQTGRFREKMDVALINDGPVTLVIDSQDARSL
jgi:D-tyrosyl-tRNA(Tyr) deacylase